MTAVEFIEPLSHDEGVKNATDLFRATYGEEPAGVWAAPGRVNLLIPKTLPKPTSMVCRPVVWKAGPPTR